MTRGDAGHRQAPRRGRLAVAALAAATIALGLATRRAPALLPPFIAEFGGDALWATMVFWLVALVRPRAATRTVATMAIGIAIAVECGQLIQWPWLVALRGTPLGALALGQGFLWSDLACYAVGVAIAAGIDVAMSRPGASGAREADARGGPTVG